MYEYKVVAVGSDLEAKLNNLGLEGYQFADVVEANRQVFVIMERETKLPGPVGISEEDTFLYPRGKDDK